MNYLKKLAVVKTFKKLIPSALMVSLFSISFISNIQAAQYSAGQVFNQSHYIQNNRACTIYLTGLRKTWSSTGNVVARIDNNKGGTISGSSTNQSGSFYYAINNYPVVQGQRVSSAIDIYTKPNNSGSVTSTFTFEYTSECGPCQVSGSRTDTVVGPAANCTQSSFAATSAEPGDSVNFSWNINNPGGTVRLTCGGAGQAGIFDANVPASGTRSIRVPSGADANDVISCSLRVGANNLCGDNLTVDGVPEIQIVKTDLNGADQDGSQRNDSQTIDSGDRARFEITVTNTGNEALKNVVVTDTEAPACNRSASQTRGLYAGSTLAPGANFTYVCVINNVTATTFADGDNDIVVRGTGNTSNINVNDDDPSTVIVIPPVQPVTPSIELLKWAANPSDKDTVKTGDNDANDTQSVESVDPNDQAVFRIKIENDGEVDLKEVVVFDNYAPQCALSKAQVAEILTQGVSTKATISNVTRSAGTNNNNILEVGEFFRYDCTQDGVRDGYTNRATTIGTPVNNAANVTSTDTTVVVICNTTTCEPISPDIEIVKTDENAADQDGAQNNDTQTIVEGNEAVFRITVTNNGGEALETVIVTDAESPSCARSVSQTVGLYPGDFFDRGESFTYVCSRGAVTTATFVDGDNDSQVSGVGVTSNTPVNDEDPSLVVVIPPTPPYAIDVLKWAANQNDKDGVNDGNNAENDTQTVESINDNDLDTAIFRIRVENVGTESLKNIRVEDAAAPVCGLTAAETLYIYSNPGNAIGSVLVTSPEIEIVNITSIPAAGDNIFNPNEFFEYDCTVSGTVDSYTNTAVAVGTPVDDSTDVTASDPSEVVVCNGPICPPVGTDPSIQIVKTDENASDFDQVQGNDTQLIAEDTKAEFRITVTNNGAKPLNEVVVSDDESPQCERSALETADLYPGTSFDPGETFTYTCEKENAMPGDFDGANGQGSVDGQNDARVDAKSVVDDAPVNDEDPSEVKFIEICTALQGEIRIDKDDTTPGQPDTDGDDTQRVPNGGTATFTITVANPGTATLTQVSVADELSPSCSRSQSEFSALLGAVGNNDQVLDAGEVITYTCTQENVAANFTNSATATGLNRDVPCAATDTDTTEVVVFGGPTDPFCGNGIIESPEACDNGALNGTVGNSCSATCTLPGGGGGDPTESAVGTCTFHESTGAAQCTRKKPVEDVSDPLWISYRECRDDSTIMPRHAIVGTIEQACALDWAEDQGLVLCGANVVGTIDPFQDLAGVFAQPEINSQCDTIVNPPDPCTPVNTPCPECFQAGNSISKQVRPADLSDVLAATATVAKGENAKYEVTVGVNGFNNATHQILDAKIRVYDHTIPTASGNIFNREGIEDGDGNGTWLWCDENALCPEYGEYFYQTMDAAKIAQLNTTGGTELKVHYDMDTAVASTKDTANIMNVAYAMIYYTYSTTDGLGNVITGNQVAGFGDNICQPAPPATISQLAQGTYGATANVHIIRPFIKARGGNAGYFGGSSDEKAFGDQNNILTPTDEDQNYGLTLTDDTSFYTGAEQGTATDFANFQDQQDDFYNNINDAANGSATFGGKTFDQVGDSQVYQFAGNLDVSAVKDITESGTFILTSGNLTVNNDFAFTNAGVFAAFIVRNGDLLIKKDVATMEGMYMVEKGEIKSSPEGDTSEVQLIVSGNMFGDLGHLLAYRRYIGNTSDIEPSIEINFDLRLLNNTPPMLEQFLGDGWREDIQG